MNGSHPKEGRAAERFRCKFSAFGAVTVDDEHGFGYRFNRDGPTGAAAGVKDRERFGEWHRSGCVSGERGIFSAHL